MPHPEAERAPLAILHPHSAAASRRSAHAALTPRHCAAGTVLPILCCRHCAADSVGAAYVTERLLEYQRIHADESDHLIDSFDLGLKNAFGGLAGKIAKVRRGRGCSGQVVRGRRRGRVLSRPPAARTLASRKLADRKSRRIRPYALHSSRSSDFRTTTSDLPAEVT